MSQSLLDSFNAEDQPFSLPNAKLTFSLDEESHTVDVVELHHLLELELSKLGDFGQVAAVIVPPFQKILSDKLNKPVSWSDSYFIFKLVDAKFAECKKKFELELTLPPTSPA